MRRVRESTACTPEVCLDGWRAATSSETIATMPEETIRAFQDRGAVRATLEADLDDARCLFNGLYAAGVDYDDVVATLEREGIETFVASFNELLKGIASKRHRLAAAA